MGRQWATYGVAGLTLAFGMFGRIASIGAMLGFAIYELCSAEAAGRPNRIERCLPGGIRVSIKFSVKGVRFHLHHWLLCALLLVILHSHQNALLRLISERVARLIYGGCIGGTAQGLRYKDRLNVVSWKRGHEQLRRCLSMHDIDSSIDEDITRHDDDDDDDDDDELSVLESSIVQQSLHVDTHNVSIETDSCSSITHVHTPWSQASSSPSSSSSSTSNDEFRFAVCPDVFAEIEFEEDEDCSSSCSYEFAEHEQQDADCDDAVAAMLHAARCTSNDGFTLSSET